jgi:hypothetical protein
MNKFASLFARAFPLLEPLVPRYISANLRRRFRKLKTRGLILDYQIRTRRLGRLHYKITVDLDLTTEQTAVILRELSNQARHALFTSPKEVMLWMRKRKAT